MIGYASETPIKTYNNVASMGATKIIMINTGTTYIIKDDKTEENTFEILQHSDRNINNS